MRPAAALPRPALLAAAAAVMLFAHGCFSPTDSTGRIPHEEIEVESSGLNNVVFVYEPIPGDPRFPHLCRLELYGDGLAVFRTGRSPQLRDSFSTDVSHPDWNHIVEGRLDLTAEQMRTVMQVFVDEGLVPSRSVRESDSESAVLQYAGNINGKKFRNATRNAILVDTFEDFAETNFSDTLRRVGARRSRP